MLGVVRASWMPAMTKREAARERGTIDDAVAILGICARTVRQLALLCELQRSGKDWATLDFQSGASARVR